MKGKRNPMAMALRSPLFKQRIVKDRKKEESLKKARRNLKTTIVKDIDNEEV